MKAKAKTKVKAQEWEVQLVNSWRYREAKITDLCDRDELNASELDALIHNALCDLDADFFDRLAHACREIKKPKVIPHEELLRALSKAYGNLRHNGHENPTWREVVELARRKFGLIRHSASTMKRIRRELGTVAILLPNPPRGKAKKRAHK